MSHFVAHHSINGKLNDVVLIKHTYVMLIVYSQLAIRHVK